MLLLSLPTLTLSGGCRLMGNPYHDELAAAGPVTTPSSAGVREAGLSPRPVRALGKEKAVSPKGGAVLHGPLYYEDPTNESGSEDGRFAATGEDFWAFWLTGIRFQLNVLLFPVSVLNTPPWMVMKSDGRPSRKLCGGTHDATPLPPLSD